VIADNQLRQFHIAETEKYAHVTYFFDGGIEIPLPGEEQLVVASPKVKSYDQVPEMSAGETTELLIKRIFTGHYSFLVINYANPDMVGHTGNFDATVKAIEFVDRKVNEVVKATLSIGGAVIITADHGNCETKVDLLTHESSKEHTTNPVPLLLIANEFKMAPKSAEVMLQEQINPTGVLADVAPTILDLLGLPAPKEMTGISLRRSLTGK
jgi:2,3-bisphosphoglycerate-independent phosphoglycerate mutase